MAERDPAPTRPPSTASGGRSAGDDVPWIIGVAVVALALAVVTGTGPALVDWSDGLAAGPRTAITVVLALLCVAAVAVTVTRGRAAAEAAARLQQLDDHDRLTGLPNRRVLGDALDDALRGARRLNARVTVVFVDLDGFKRVNDTFGHDVGDQLMVAVADRLRRAVADTDVLVRYGGDEFVVICPEVSTPVAAERVAKRLLAAIEAPFTAQEQPLTLSGSVGVVVTEERCGRPEEVLRDADAAMYRAKSLGPGRYAIFDRSVTDQLTPSTAERRLRQALDDGEFRLYYQPIVSLWTKRLVGLEALIRWDDPDRGMVNPREFLPALEDSGLIVPIGNWVIEEVCRQSREWQDRYPDRPSLNIKVNVSARELAQANFVSHLRACLAETGAHPDRLCLEITEGALMYDVSSAWSTLREVKALGVSLALDDFGTGYSSLSYLRQFNLDLLKIDQSFIDGLSTNREDATIIEHVIGLAKALGIVTVAEGVETGEQMQRLRDMSCDLAQGYWFSHPQPPEVIDHLLADNGNSLEWRPPDRTGDGPGDEGDLFGTPPPDAAAPVVALPRLPQR